MNISDLKTGQGSVEVEGAVTELSEPRTFNKFGRDLVVATATLVDSSGSIKLSLWNQDVEKVKVGDKVKITNGYVNEFQGEKQLTSGKFGKLEVTGKVDISAVQKPEQKSEQPEEETKTEKIKDVVEEDEKLEEGADEGEEFY
ncbi:MAG: SOSS complex subunit B family protein [archaeon]